MSKRLPFIPPFVLAAVMLSGMWSACTHTPVAPPNPPDTTHKTDSTKGDTIHRVLKIDPDSASVQLLYRLTFKATPTPGPLPKPYSLIWRVDTTSITHVNSDTLSWTFAAAGKHTVNVSYVDSTGKTRATSSTLITVTPKPADPNDTTSHNFVWTEYTNVNGENNMTGCWVFGPNDIYAINGDLHHFDGTTWSTIVVHDDSGNSFQGSLSGCSIFAFADNDMWFTHGSYAAHYLGNGLVHPYSLYSLNHGRSYACWGLSSQDLFVVGDSGLVAHFDGTNWTKFPKVTNVELDAIWGTSSSDVWASGYGGHNETVLMHYDGSTWAVDPISFIPTPISGGYGSVWCCDSANHKITIASGTIVYRKTDNGSWRNSDSGKVPNYSGGYLALGMLGNSANDFFGIGGYGLICHWNGKSWYRYDQYFEPNNLSFFTGGESVNGNTVCVVGAKNGTSWILVGQRK